MSNLVTLKESKYFLLQYDSETDALAAVVEGTPNYFVVNKKTKKIEGYGNMEILMLVFLDEIEKRYNHFYTVGELLDEEPPKSSLH